MNRKPPRKVNANSRASSPMAFDERAVLGLNEGVARADRSAGLKARGQGDSIDMANT